MAYFTSLLLSNMTVITLFFLCLFIYCRESAAQLSTAEKQDTLGRHNDLRRNESASDMLLMVTS